jgi:arsenate reductase (thioredoxin)
MEIIKVLFICIHNSARSQMAEAFLNLSSDEGFRAESAGLEPGSLNQIVVEVMKEVGIDIANNKTKSVFDFYKDGKRYDYVITVCDEASAERCPIFPSAKKTIHWSFSDPSAVKGSKEEIMGETRIIRDQIKSKVQSWVKEMKKEAV